MVKGKLSEIDITARYSTDFVYLQYTWFFVLQYPIVTFILAIAQSITQAQGTFCLEGNKVYFAHLWVSIFSLFNLVDNVSNTLDRSQSFRLYHLLWQ